MEDVYHPVLCTDMLLIKVFANKVISSYVYEHTNVDFVCDSINNTNLFKIEDFRHLFYIINTFVNKNDLHYVEYPL